MANTEFDVLVIGGGMAGLTAAASAAREGKSVCVVDIASDVGGSARFAGYVWTAPSYEVLHEQNPDGDPALKRRLIDGFADGVEWIRSIGVDVGEAQKILSFGRGHKFDTNHYIDICKRSVIQSGGTVMLDTVTESLVLDGGVVRGARVRTGSERSREVHAGHTLLATGGFQGGKDLIARHVHAAAGSMELRSNPHSRGDGYRLATANGAATRGENAGFYGHLIPSGVRLTDPADFVDMSLYYSEHALLFNLNNERFVDETLGDHLTTMELLAQPESRGLLIADARVHRDWMLASYVEGAVAVDKFEIAGKRGGRVGRADFLDELEYLPEEWGYDGAVIASNIARYNNSAERRESLAPGRALDAEPLAEPPYYVIETAPAITFPFHGVSIDAHARVLDTGGVPIPGLLAAGSDTGGLWDRAYAGGLASALVFGRAAAETVLNSRIQSAAT
ncbi:cytochrome C [Rhodococcus sp. 06-156-3C]|uniref:FAD-dependent oxidoreductase n=1 Tax=Nocardiaceae TaxID=85025 RepID=UPI000522F6FD|nr:MULTISPECIES: FAD-dependent oxidoreductase [Rhodococcus]OZD11386.1 cytochrome C [Rhodococcus sp. 06-156-3C]OZD13622.1 cytochrome C [Rhodococcus sp. 06-156-4a]OZD22037.1 cytochrome C [Rhodococcus sp. 06-156-4C]OZD30245.1 cytochrome C [Rhodococcus sp. 06-156-3]OZD37652.1 cytochrome C [Rhodococcus sp. 06-156-3b]